MIMLRTQTGIKLMSNLQFSIENHVTCIGFDNLRFFVFSFLEAQEIPLEFQLIQLIELDSLPSYWNNKRIILTFKMNTDSIKKGKNERNIYLPCKQNVNMYNRMDKYQSRHNLQKWWSQPFPKMVGYLALSLFSPKYFRSSCCFSASRMLNVSFRV